MAISSMATRALIEASFRSIIVLLIICSTAMIQEVDGQGCAQYCVTCTARGAGSCDKCNSGYGLSDATTANPTRICLPCDPNCATTCANAGGKKCDGICKTGYTLDDFTKTCNFSGVIISTAAAPSAVAATPSATPGCCAFCTGTCGTPGSCDLGSCANGYGLSDGRPQICAPCDPNCAPPSTCLESGQCTSGCISGYTLNQFSHTCSRITTATTTLSTSPTTSTSTSTSTTTTATTKTTTTTTKAPNIPTVPSTTASNAASTPAGSVTMTSNAPNVPTVSISTNSTTPGSAITGCCANCLSGCTRNGPGSCDLCSGGYGLTNTQPPTCGVCSQHCVKGCSSKGAGFCDSCDPGYGYISTASPSCGACDPNCAVNCWVSGAGKCDGSCNRDYTLNRSTQQCMPSVNSLSGRAIRHRGVLEGVLLLAVSALAVVNARLKSLEAGQ